MASKRRQSDTPREVQVGNTLPDDRLRLLARRLEDGYARIDQAALAGTDVSGWETFWIKLLREYEHVCSELERAA